MVGTDSVEEINDIEVSVDFPKDAKIDEATIQQIVESIIRIVSKIENVTISEEFTNVCEFLKWGNRKLCLYQSDYLNIL